MASYSKRSLSEKLGIKSGSKILFSNEPQNYKEVLGSLPKTVMIEHEGNGPFDLIQYFTTQQKKLKQSFPKLKEKLAIDGSLWISWPKQSSKVPTDLNENDVMHIGLEYGLVDVKVIAVDETWSGLKFVYRLKDRI